MSELVALLGRRDAPTDALQDYCGWLGQALLARGHRLQPVRVPWRERGWPRALASVWRASAAWRGGWVLVQYTAMSWSRRGFPLGLIVVLALLRFRSCRIAIVFHDPAGFPGRRWIDRLRRTYQQQVMRTAYRWAERAILNVPVDRVTWLPPQPVRAACIPVGSNVPASVRGEVRERKTRRVIVFGVTGGDSGRREVTEIVRAMRAAAETVSGLQLVVVGRGSAEAEDGLRRTLTGTTVDLSVLGLLPAEDISRLLAHAEALLFVRGPFSSQRATGIAGIACGVPVVGFAGPQTGPPVTQAGVVLVPWGDEEALARALTRVLTDRALWIRLHERSVEAYGRHFSWDAIAERFVETLRL